MIEKLRIIFTIPELRKKILLTLFLLLVYRIGWQIPLPVVDTTKAELLQSDPNFGDFMKQVSLFSASRLNMATIFGLGIMPYISASIIFQLLASVWGPLEKLQKEGETGRKKINEYTRYATVLICLGQSWFFVGMLQETYRADVFYGGLAANGMLRSWQIVCVLIMTCGTIFLMWLGEQIDEFGIGNGISLLIMAGILARMPAEAIEMLGPLLTQGVELGGASATGKYGIETLLILMVLFVAVVAGVVFIYQGQRRIPTQSAKAVRGRRVYGGTRQYLPLRVNQSGVMPIIFASSLLLIPAMIFDRAGRAYPDFFINFSLLGDSFQRGTSFSYNVLYVVLIYFFCYFWTAITFNPKDMANNLKDFGSFIPGYRPGKRTADYLEKVMVRITYVGAGFLALVAITPTIISAGMGVDASLASFYGGTGLLIAVSVAFDLVQKIDSHLVMRNYKGLLEA
ncbi:MAG: preprotein translocase subunit SecY [Planctomycetia bacterium]|nr:preprotein translocase subunit SecY [Planctomycetia bacterium]